MELVRLDIFIHQNGFVETRNKAQELIKNSLVFVNDVLINKASFKVSQKDKITILDQNKYVSRAAIKLEYAKKIFNINFKNKTILDIGASTGGFTDFSIKNGAKLVYALDVGTNQLHYSLRNNKKVINLEKTHLKEIEKINFKENIDIILCDVSFISLKYVFQNIKSIVNINTIMIFLIKPQFELSKEILDKTKGLINNEKHHNLAINNVKNYAKQNNISLLNIVESPIKGAKMKNKEFLGYFKLWNQ